MRVGINMAIKRRGISGTTRVLEELEHALQTQPDIEIAAAVPPASRPRTRAGRLMTWVWWDLWKAARTVADVDVFVSPCNVGRAPRGMPHLLLMLDTMPLDHPRWYDVPFAVYARLLFGPSARASTRVMTISSYSAARIEARWPQMAPVEVLRLPAEPQATEPRALPNEPLRVLLVSATAPHKNHEAAIEAVRLAREWSDVDIRLRIIGPVGRAEPEVRRLVRHADPAGQWCTREIAISDRDLHGAYATGWVLLQPSLDEGFGLSVLEAASHALPVVHSGRGAMPEVVRTGNVNSVAGADFARALIPLLDETEYLERSGSVLEDARGHSPDRFRDDLLRVLTEVRRGA